MEKNSKDDIIKIKQENIVLKNDLKNANITIENLIKELNINVSINCNLKNEIISKENEINSLKNKLNNNIPNNIDTNNIKTETTSREDEINKLKNDLLKANKIIENLKFEKNKNMPFQDINKYKTEIIMKDNIINRLRNELETEKNKDKNNLINYEDIIVIYFTSLDQTINKHGIKCLKTDTFAEIEEKLYREYEEGNFRDTNNTFIVNGGPVLRFKKLYENKIKDGDIIQLIKNE